MPSVTASGSAREMSASWYERLSPVDATFLWLEGPATPMHVGGIV